MGGSVPIPIRIKNQDRLEWFFKDAPIQIRHDRAGSYAYKGSLIFGTELQESALESVLHEMAHLVEISDSRMVLEDWGFEVDRGYYWKPAMDREIRVHAWEVILYSYLGCRFERKWHNILSNVRFAITQSDKRQREFDFDLKAYIKKEFNRLFKTYDINRFKKEWKRKMKVLKKLLAKAD